MMNSLDMDELDEGPDSMNYDAPTPEETEIQRSMLEGRVNAGLSDEDQSELQEVEYSEYMRLIRAEDSLRASKDAGTLQAKVKWLKERGYDGVNVSGHPKALDFEDAMGAGYGNNVHCMFMREVGKLKRMYKESKSYLEKTGFFRKQNN